MIDLEEDRRNCIFKDYYQLLYIQQYLLLLRYELLAAVRDLRVYVHLNTIQGLPVYI
jgi:hypothetical protein